MAKRKKQQDLDGGQAVEVLDPTDSAPATQPPETFQYVALDRLAESKTNPRKRFGDLEDLAASIRSKGVVQPVLVRVDAEDTTRFELVAGARRFRAAKLAGLEQLPAMVRELDDLAVLELQAIENNQRADVHPMEEAQAYAHLIEASAKAGHAIDAHELARRLGRSVSYVYQRLQLAKLTKKAAAAFLEERITAGHAVDLARLTPADQEEALAYTLEGRDARWNKDERERCLSVRALRRWISENLHLDLAKAPFDVADVELVPKAGACTTCPKRTGAVPELFADVKKGDTCTDRACYQAKRAAVGLRQLEAAKEKGRAVMDPAKAKKVLKEHSYSGRHNGWVDVSEASVYMGRGEVKLATLAKREKLETTLALDPRTGDLLELLPQAAAEKLEQKARREKSRSSPDPWRKKAAAEQKKAKLNRAVSRRVLGVLAERVREITLSEPRFQDLLDLVAEAVVAGLAFDASRVLAEMLGRKDEEQAAEAATDDAAATGKAKKKARKNRRQEVSDRAWLRAHLRGLPTRDKMCVAFQAVAIEASCLTGYGAARGDDAPLQRWGRDDAEREPRLLDYCKLFGVDFAKIKGQVLAELEPKKKAAKKKGAKAGKAKATGKARAKASGKKPKPAARKTRRAAKPEPEAAPVAGGVEAEASPKGNGTVARSSKKKGTPGTCSGCGCTEDKACIDGATGLPCSWADGTRTLCSCCAASKPRRRNHRVTQTRHRKAEPVGAAS